MMTFVCNCASYTPKKVKVKKRTAEVFQSDSAPNSALNIVFQTVKVHIQSGGYETGGTLFSASSLRTDCS